MSYNNNLWIAHVKWLRMQKWQGALYESQQGKNVWEICDELDFWMTGLGFYKQLLFFCEFA